MTKKTAPPSPKVSLTKMLTPEQLAVAKLSPQDALRHLMVDDEEENSTISSSASDEEDANSESSSEQEWGYGSSSDEDSDDFDDEYSTSSYSSSDFSDEDAEAMIMGLGLANFMQDTDITSNRKKDAPTIISNMAICKDLMRRVDHANAATAQVNPQQGLQTVRPLFPAKSRQAFSRTASIANFEALGHSASGEKDDRKKPAVGLTPAERRAAFSKTSSIANFQAMRHKSGFESLEQAKQALYNLADIPAPAEVSPEDYLASLLGKKPINLPFDSLNGFFLEGKEEHVLAWDTELVGTIRNQDLPALKRHYKAGRQLQACNQFGESIVHLCVRRGTPEMLSFLVNKVHLTIRVCCDYGKTPLHDACWCLSSNYVDALRMMEIIVRECPMMLCITDKRNFTPLSYVPKSKWADCRGLLKRLHKEGLFSSLE